MGRYLLNEWFALCCGNSFLWLCPILQYHKKDLPNNYLTIIYKSPWDIIKIIFYCKIIFTVRKKELHGRVTFHCFFPFWPVLIREQEIFKPHNRSQFQKFKSSLQKANFNSASISWEPIICQAPCWGQNWSKEYLLSWCLNIPGKRFLAQMVI